MPTVFVTQDEGLTNSNLFDGGDEVNDLNILRLMAKRSYIISCYESVVESKNYSGAKDSDSSGFPESPESPGLSLLKFHPFHHNNSGSVFGENPDRIQPVPELHSEEAVPLFQSAQNKFVCFFQ